MLTYYTEILAFNVCTYVDIFARTQPLYVATCGWCKLPPEIWGCLIQVTTQFWIPAWGALSHTPGVTGTNASLVHGASKVKGKPSAQTAPSGKCSWARKVWQTCKLWLCPHTDISSSINLFQQNRLNKIDKKPGKILECMIYFDIRVGVKHISLLLTISL